MYANALKNIKPFSIWLIYNFAGLYKKLYVIKGLDGFFNKNVFLYIKKYI